MRVSSSVFVDNQHRTAELEDLSRLLWRNGAARKARAVLGRNIWNNNSNNDGRTARWEILFRVAVMTLLHAESDEKKSFMVDFRSNNPIAYDGQTGPKIENLLPTLGM